MTRPDREDVQFRYFGNPTAIDFAVESRFVSFMTTAYRRWPALGVHGHETDVARPGRGYLTFEQAVCLSARQSARCNMHARPRSLSSCSTKSERHDSG
jgi:hypothetical protein